LEGLLAPAPVLILSAQVPEASRQRLTRLIVRVLSDDLFTC